MPYFVNMKIGKIIFYLNRDYIKRPFSERPARLVNLFVKLLSRDANYMMLSNIFVLFRPHPCDFDRPFHGVSLSLDGNVLFSIDGHVKLTK